VAGEGGLGPVAVEVGVLPPQLVALVVPVGLPAGAVVPVAELEILGRVVLRQARIENRVVGVVTDIVGL
jgi:hypothetical protein